jgi:hypothetical protein
MDVANKQILEHELSLRLHKNILDVPIEKVFSYCEKDRKHDFSSNSSIFKRQRDTVIVLKTHDKVYCCFTDQSLMYDGPMNTDTTSIICCNDGIIWRNISDSASKYELYKKGESLFPFAFLSAPESYKGFCSIENGWLYVRVSKQSCPPPVL